MGDRGDMVHGSGWGKESSGNADMTEDSAPEDPKEEISFTADRSDCLSYDPLYPGSRFSFSILISDF